MLLACSLSCFLKLQKLHFSIVFYHANSLCDWFQQKIFRSVLSRMPWSEASFEVKYNIGLQKTDTLTEAKELTSRKRVVIFSPILPK
jgi:hypothetical protein